MATGLKRIHRMDLRNRHTLANGYNWLMVAVALGWIVYMFAGLFSSPTDSQTLWSPPRVVVQRALPVQATSAPAWGPAHSSTDGFNRDTASRPSRVAVSNSESSPTESAPPPDPELLWGDGAPYAVAPEGRVDPISPVHHALGPDF